METILQDAVQAGMSALDAADTVLQDYGMGALNGVAQYVSDQTHGSLPAHGLRPLLAMLLSTPVACVYRLLPDSPGLKHLFNIIQGVWFAWFCFGRYEWLHVFLAPVAVWALLAVVPRNRAGAVVFIAVNMHLLYGYADKFLNTERSMMGVTVNRVTWTLVHCVMTLKLTSLAFNYTDGAPGASAKPGPYTLATRPSLVQMLGYTHCHCGFMTGPYFEYAEYRDFTSLAMFPDKRVPTGGTFLAVWRMVVFFAATLCCQGILSKFPPRVMATDAYLNDWSFLPKVLFFCAVGHFTNLRYALMWGVSESSAIMSGLGYQVDPRTKEVSWSRFRNANIFGIELGLSLADFMRNFNIRTNTYLRLYINRRLAAKGYHPSSCLLATFVYLALWHGFWPGYYFCFVAEYTLIFSLKSLSAIGAPVYARAKNSTPLRWGYNAVCFLCFHVSLYFIQVPFWLLESDKGWAAWCSLFFFVPALQVVIYVTEYGLKASGVLVPPPPRAKRIDTASAPAGKKNQ